MPHTSFHHFSFDLTLFGWLISMYYFFYVNIVFYLCFLSFYTHFFEEQLGHKIRPQCICLQLNPSWLSVARWILFVVWFHLHESIVWIFFYCYVACIIQGFLFDITLPGLSHRRPTSVTTVLRGLIKETLCISVSSNKLFLQPHYVS